jgi:hypothetical protein
MLKTLSTWFRSRVLHEDLVARLAEAASEQWEDVPFTVNRVLDKPGGQTKRRPTPPPMPPGKTRPALLALAKASVAPIDPADVPTPPPLTKAPPLGAAVRDPNDVPTPPPLSEAPRQVRPRPPAPARALTSDDMDWDSAIARAKGGRRPPGPRH